MEGLLANVNKMLKEVQREVAADSYQKRVDSPVDPLRRSKAEAARTL